MSQASDDGILCSRVETLRRNGVMENSANRARSNGPLIVGLTLFAALFIGACGGGDGGSAPQQQAQNSGPGPLDEGGIICEFVAILLGGECVGIGNGPTCSDDPFNNQLGLPECDEPVPPPVDTSNGWITPYIYGSPDTEPNNDISTPAQATLNGRLQNGGRGGFRVNGTLNTLSDPADVFIFTLTTSGNLEFSLCFFESQCRADANNRVDAGTAYVSVLDQNGALIWSANDDPTAGNLQEFWIEAGVPHYVMLVAADTMGSDLGYRLTVVEAQNQVKVSPPLPQEQSAPNAPEIINYPMQSDLTVALDWLPPSANANGTALLDLAGYKFYVSPTPIGPFTLVKALYVIDTTSHTISIPDAGDWYVVMTALDSERQESAYSSAIFIASILPPAPEDGV